MWKVLPRIAGAAVANQTVGPLVVGANGTANFTVRATPGAAVPVALWSVARPALHTARFTVRVGGAAAPAGEPRAVWDRYLVRV